MTSRSPGSINIAAPPACHRDCRNADLIVRERFHRHRCGATPMKPRASIAHYSRAEGLTVWLTTQRSHIKRHLLAEYFRAPDSRIRVVAPKDVGGGFGVKAPLYREDIVVCALR